MVSDTAAKLVFLSDTHLPSANEKDVLRLVGSEKPDAILFGGDGCDASGADCENFFGNLSEIAPVYAVMGNHEYYGSKIPDAAYLDNSKTAVAGATICGVTHYGPKKVSGCDISLVHSYANAEYANDSRLVLVGHSHGGQVEIPFVTQSLLDTFLCKGCGTHRQGEFFDSGTRIYVTSGTGSFFFRQLQAHLNARFLHPPEIVVVELQPR
ncbi:MAG: metallophosphoesterase family protein [Candidatus Micrarchaeia archaeon]